MPDDKSAITAKRSTSFSSFSLNKRCADIKKQTHTEKLKKRNEHIDKMILKVIKP